MENLCKEIGIVIIGRNEGERLKQCITSVLNQIDKIIYVDSGSSDGSAEYAESMGLDVLRLDMSAPFSAARARNEGFDRLIKNYHELEYIQFIDGDCQCCEGWLSFAYGYLQENDSVAVVSGRRKEKFPEDSIYNKLCDIEWNSPVGEAKACGGDFMIKKTAFVQVGGFNPSVIAGEEPEMCYRLTEKNWSIFRLDHAMTTHDAAITRFSQWWKRCQRAGHAFAQGFILHFRDGKGYCLKESVRIWFWAFVVPIFIIIPSFFISRAFLLFTAVYLIQFVKIARRMYQRHRNTKLSLMYSFFIVIGKWPELIGQLQFYKNKLLRKRHTIIEYT